jgi:hypothetical protein
MGQQALPADPKRRLEQANGSHVLAPSATSSAQPQGLMLTRMRGTGRWRVESEHR